MVQSSFFASVYFCLLYSCATVSCRPVTIPNAHAHNLAEGMLISLSLPHALCIGLYFPNQMTALARTLNWWLFVNFCVTRYELVYNYVEDNLKAHDSLYIAYKRLLIFKLTLGVEYKCFLTVLLCWEYANDK